MRITRRQFNRDLDEELRLHLGMLFPGRRVAVDPLVALRYE
jgi:hypothetical protein